jgi:hypothetical protein
MSSYDIEISVLREKIVFCYAIISLSLISGRNKAPLPIRLDIEGCEVEPCRVKMVGKIHFGLDFITRKCHLRLKSY